MILHAENGNRVSIASFRGMVLLGADMGGAARKSIAAQAFSPEEARSIADLILQAADLASAETAEKEKMPK